MVCEDYGTPRMTSSSSLQIEITDANDNRPIFGSTSYQCEVAENNGVGIHLITVVAFDADVAQDHSKVFYYFIDGGGQISSLWLSSSSSVTSTFLSTSSSSSFSSSLTSSSPSSSSSSPSFPSLKLSASTSSSKILFKIETETGKVTAESSLDREKMPTYRLKIVAMDRKEHPLYTTTTTLEVIVLDQNDEKPTFDRNHYTFSILESVKPGYIVGSVTATDSDEYPQNLFYYKIRELDRHSHNYSEMIDKSISTLSKTLQLGDSKDRNFYSSDHGICSVDTVSGEIILNFPVDREKRGSIEFLVEAVEQTSTDDYPDDLNSRTKMRAFLNESEVPSALVTVQIIDVNDCAPIFIYPQVQTNFTAFIDDGMEGTVAWVSALDRDVDATNSAVFYTITNAYKVIDVTPNVSSHSSASSHSPTSSHPFAPPSLLTSTSTSFPVSSTSSSASSPSSPASLSSSLFSSDQHSPIHTPSSSSLSSSLRHLQQSIVVAAVDYFDVFSIDEQSGEIKCLAWRMRTKLLPHKVPSC
ncbi:hypothetical protein HELRODRAFT_164489 [Helobdella robusta]|uniref:Cadherin domain-containing protein n=1 Tax=Helobdella robusta TaxID=6412 RepID=T1EVH8_HELRO|nr:hypothetical protein HELRODRAFT_164489 [Helobdella robusta]ESN94623.1 hypothetical protein HELRODRAFT_164489 [Helobdella robusta]